LRPKIGLIVPSTNTVMEPDFWRLAVEAGATVHTARMHHDLELEPAERLTLMAEYARQAVLDLATARVDVLVYGCTSGSFFFGPTWDDAHSLGLGLLAGIPLVSTSQATVEALKALEMKRVCVVTPYSAELSAPLPAYLDEHGIAVLNMVSVDRYNVAGGPASMTPDVIAQAVREAWRPDADGVYFACTGVSILDQLQALEAELGKPVVSANGASWWAAWSHLKRDTRHPGLGRLLEHGTRELTWSS
jgi:maleate isomerase